MLSTFAFNFNLRRYTEAVTSAARADADEARAAVGSNDQCSQRNQLHYEPSYDM